MDNFLDQFKFALEVAWDNAKYQASGHVILAAVVVGAVLILLWIFWSAGLRKKG